MISLSLIWKNTYQLYYLLDFIESNLFLSRFFKSWPRLDAVTFSGLLFGDH